MADISEPDDMPRYNTSRRSAELDKLATALAKAQGAMSNAEKTGENPAFKRDGKASTYATLASVLDAVRKPLSDNGLSITQWPRTNGQGVEIETVLKHESGQYMRDVLWLPCPQMTVHTVGSMVTYLRRYTLMAVVGIAPSDEDDGNAAAEAHKPGVPGSAGGGTDFRPAGSRRYTGHSSPHGRELAAEEPHLVANANGRVKGTTGTPTTADRQMKEAIAKAKAWNETAMGTLKLSGQTPDTLSQFLVDHHKWIRFMEDHVPDEHEQFFAVFNAVMETAQARVS